MGRPKKKRSKKTKINEPETCRSKKSNIEVQEQCDSLDPMDKLLSDIGPDIRYTGRDEK